MDGATTEACEPRHWGCCLSSSMLTRWRRTLVSWAQDAAVLHLQTGKEEVRFAMLAIQYAEERGAGDVTRAKEIVRRME